MTPDPSLGRLKVLLRLQLVAARRGQWTTLTALGTEVTEQLIRDAATPAPPLARMEVAHLQLQLEGLLRTRAEAMALRLDRCRVAGRYRRLAR